VVLQFLLGVVSLYELVEEVACFLVGVVVLVLVLVSYRVMMLVVVVAVVVLIIQQ
jgi:hypothetical protein